MPSGSEETPPPDHGLVEPIAIPADSRVPSPGRSNSDEYDLYFRIQRQDSGLLAWSRTCLDVERRVLQDLPQTRLSSEERCKILEGLLLVQQVTLESWVRAGEESLRAASEEKLTDGD